MMWDNRGLEESRVDPFRNLLYFLAVNLSSSNQNKMQSFFSIFLHSFSHEFLLPIFVFSSSSMNGDMILNDSIDSSQAQNDSLNKKAMESTIGWTLS